MVPNYNQLRDSDADSSASYAESLDSDADSIASDANSVDSIAQVFAEVEAGEALYGVVPVENSTEGMVNQQSLMHHIHVEEH